VAEESSFSFVSVSSDPSSYKTGLRMTVVFESFLLYCHSEAACS